MRRPSFSPARNSRRENPLWFLPAPSSRLASGPRSPAARAAMRQSESLLRSICSEEVDQVIGRIEHVIPMFSFTLSLILVERGLSSSTLQMSNFFDGLV